MPALARAYQLASETAAQEDIHNDLQYLFRRGGDLQDSVLDKV